MYYEEEGIGCGGVVAEIARLSQEGKADRETVVDNLMTRYNVPVDTASAAIDLAAYCKVIYAEGGDLKIRTPQNISR